MRVSADLVRRVANRIDRVIKELPDKFPGRVVKVIYCLRTLPGPWRKPIN